MPSESSPWSESKITSSPDLGLQPLASAAVTLFGPQVSSPLCCAGSSPWGRWGDLGHVVSHTDLPCVWNYHRGSGSHLGKEAAPLPTAQQPQHVSSSSLAPETPPLTLPSRNHTNEEAEAQLTWLTWGHVLGRQQIQASDPAGATSLCPGPRGLSNCTSARAPSICWAAYENGGNGAWV